MTKDWIELDELYPRYTLTEDPEYGDEVEVPDDRLQYWKKTIDEFFKVQQEMQRYYEAAPARHAKLSEELSEWNPTSNQVQVRGGKTGIIDHVWLKVDTSGLPNEMRIVRAFFDRADAEADELDLDIMRWDTNEHGWPLSMQLEPGNIMFVPNKIVIS